MADNCTYTYKNPDGEEKKFDDKDELYRHLLSDEVQPEHILSRIKPENYATPKGQGPQQESDQQTGVEEHPGTGTPREEKASTETGDSNRGGDGEGTRKEKEIADRDRTVGIKNAAVNEDRAARGLKPVIKAARKRFGQVWEEVRAHVIQGTADPRAFVNNLAERFKANERFGVTDYDNALVLMDRIDLTNQRINAIDDYEKAVKSGNDMLEAVSWQRLQEIEGKLQQNDEVADKMGTVASLALGTRRAMANLDFSLAQMKKEIGVYYPGGIVPPEMQKRLEQIEKQHQEALAKLQEYEEKWKQQQAEKQFTDEVNKNKKTTSSASKPGPKPKNQKATGKELADRIRAIRPRTDIAQSNIFGLGIALYDTALVIAANVVEGGGKLVDAIQAAVDHIKKNGGFPSKEEEDNFRAHLNGIDAPEEQDRKEYLTNKISELAKNSNAETVQKDMITPIRQLINQYAKEGHTDFQTVLEKVHQDLKGSFGNLTQEDLRDAYSGYGDSKLETKTELQKKLAKWKQEAIQWAQMQQILADEKPSKKKGGAPNPEMDKKRAQLEKRMREAGITWENAPNTEEEKNKRALDSLKTRIKNQIDQLTQAIENRRPLAKSGKIQLDEEAKNMIKQRDALKETLNSILGKEDKKTLSDKDRIERAQKALEKQIASLEDDIKAIHDNTYQGKSKPKKLPFNSTLELLRGRKEALQELKRKLVIDYDPNSNQSTIALEKYKDGLRNKILDFSQRMENNDFEDKPNKPAFQTDAEAKKLELQLKQAQSAFAQEKLKAQKDNQTRLQKIYKKIVQIKRFGILFNFPILGKIAMQNIYRTVFNPVEELIGAGATMLIPGVKYISERAPREGGGLNIKAESSALQEWAKADTWKDALNVLKTGQSELDHMFGKHTSMPPEMLEIWGHLHGALQTPVRRAEFARSYQKRMDYAISKGADPSDELTQLTAQSKAFEDANRAVFLQKNIIADWINKVLGSAERSDNPFKNLAAFAGRYFVPFTKLPANVIRESANYYLGIPRVAIESIIRTLRGSWKDLSEDQADSLMRSLKKGSIGAAMFTIGFTMSNSFGGIYRGKQKKEDGDLDIGEMQIGDVTLPKWVSWSPFFMMAQFGATARKVMERDISQGDESGSALTDGIVKSSRGLFGEAPLFNQVDEVERALDSKDFANQLLYPELLSPIPGIIPTIARQMDKDESGNIIKRSPSGLGEQFEYRIPGLRENVPTAEERKEMRAEEKEKQEEGQ